MHAMLSLRVSIAQRRSRTVYLHTHPSHMRGHSPLPPSCLSLSLFSILTRTSSGDPDGATTACSPIHTSSSEERQRTPGGELLGESNSVCGWLPLGRSKWRTGRSSGKGGVLPSRAGALTLSSRAELPSAAGRRAAGPSFSFLCFQKDFYTHLFQN
jgi:hypothetical protein